MEQARRARRTQAAVLRSKLRLNGDSDFGQRYRLSGVRTFADLAQRVPITSYDAYAADIERLKAGDTRALLGPRQRLLMFALTSGTTREPKYVPVTSAFLAEYRRGWNVWGLKALEDHPGCILRHITQVSSPMNESMTTAGVPCGAITGLMASTQKRLVRRFYTAPLAVSAIPDPRAKYYVIMRLAVPKDVAFLITANPATLLLLVQTADAHRAALIRDVHDGTISTAFEIPDTIRAELSRRLRSDPAAARRLEALVSTHDVLRPRDYWRLGFVAHWLGGTMGLYRPRFEPWFGRMPVRDPGLLASEGRMSIPIADDTPAGILDVTSHAFEFIPAEDYESDARRAIGIEAIETDGEYFLLLTTSSGFWRYDIGDRVRVVDWFGEAPVIEFLSKGAHTSSMTGEKLTEHHVVEAMRDAAARCNAVVDTFIVAPRWAELPYYRVYLQAGADGADPIDAGRLATSFDGALCRENIEYRQKRDSQRLGPVQAAVLPHGTIDAIDAARRQAQAGRAEQFKHQYLLAEPGMDDAWINGLRRQSGMHGPPQDPASEASGPRR